MKQPILFGTIRTRGDVEAFLLAVDIGEQKKHLEDRLFAHFMQLGVVPTDAMVVEARRELEAAQ